MMSRLVIGAVSAGLSIMGSVGVSALALTAGLFLPISFSNMLVKHYLPNLAGQSGREGVESVVK